MEDQEMIDELYRRIEELEGQVKSCAKVYKLKEPEGLLSFVLFRDIVCGYRIQSLDDQGIWIEEQDGFGSYRIKYNEPVPEWVPMEFKEV